MEICFIIYCCVQINIYIELAMLFYLFLHVWISGEQQNFSFFLNIASVLRSTEIRAMRWHFRNSLSFCDSINISNTDNNNTIDDDDAWQERLMTSFIVNTCHQLENLRGIFYVRITSTHLYLHSLASIKNEWEKNSQHFNVM